jgi:hypothetical protein
MLLIVRFAPGTAISVGVAGLIRNRIAVSRMSEETSPASELFLVSCLLRKGGKDSTYMMYRSRVRRYRSRRPPRFQFKGFLQFLPLFLQILLGLLVLIARVNLPSPLVEWIRVIGHLMVDVGR